MRNGLEINKSNRMPTWNMPDIEDMFERAFRNPLSLFEDMRPAVNLENRWMQPHFDVEETDQAYLLCIDLPGVKKEDVKVDLVENLLTITGERKYEQEEKYGSSRRFERSHGQFQRSFTLPNSVDAKKVEASLEDGVLRVALPKSEQSKPRSIQVQAGKSGIFSKLIGSSRKDGVKTEEEINNTH